MKAYDSKTAFFKECTENFHGPPPLVALTGWNRNRNWNQGFRAGIRIGMESVGFTLELESEPESDLKIDFSRNRNQNQDVSESCITGHNASFFECISEAT